MKKIVFILIAIIGIVSLFSCEKELRDPKLDSGQTVSAGITEPASGSAIILTSENAENPFTISWTATTYNLDNLEPANYLLQMDAAGSDFANAYDLVTTSETSYQTTVGEMNNLLLALEYAVNEAHTMEFRVLSYITDASSATDAYSEVITLSITTYEDIIVVLPIYLLGDATPVEWDNTIALPMAHLGEGRFARVEYLDPGIGDWFKFISVLGAWAPQWGTDDTGTPEAGPLVYRPTEDDDDPVAMPVPLEAGNYYIEADTVNLSYMTFWSSGSLFLVGEATTVGWDAAAALPFEEVEPHIFEITTTLGDGGMKFLEIQGEWAPQWGTNEEGTAEGGPLIFRPDEVTTDPAEVPSPGAGTFKIRVDLTTISYTIEAQ